MWCLVDVQSGRRHWVLPTGCRYRVGRKTDSDLVLDHVSVSRMHASLWAVAGGSLMVHDESRFGTHCNGVRVEGDAAVQRGDTIVFGAQSPPFRVEASPLALYVLKARGGRIASQASQSQQQPKGGPSWNALPRTSDVASCSHVVLLGPVETVTQPLLLALLLCKPVVSGAWADAVVGRAAMHDPLPDEAAYLPECATVDASCLRPQPARGALLKGLCVALPTAKVDAQLGAICRAAGATVVGPGRAAIEHVVAMLPSRGVCFVAPKAGDEDDCVAALRAAHVPQVTAEMLVRAVLTATPLPLDAGLSRAAKRQEEEARSYSPATMTARQPQAPLNVAGEATASAVRNVKRFHKQYVARAPAHDVVLAAQMRVAPAPVMPEAAVAHVRRAAADHDERDQVWRDSLHAAAAAAPKKPRAAHK